MTSVMNDNKHTITIQHLPVAGLHRLGKQSTGAERTACEWSLAETERSTHKPIKYEYLISPHYESK